jgi:hypothetical protein
MCGRYVRRSDKQRIAEHLRIDPTTLPDLEASYNIAPPTFQQRAAETRSFNKMVRERKEAEVAANRWPFRMSRLVGSVSSLGRLGRY